MSTDVRRRIARVAGVAPILCLATGLSALGATRVGATRDRPTVTADDPVGVYGYVRRVVFEPETGPPERMQVWGNFAVAVPDDPTSYHVPEPGYLYFRLPPDAASALAEWQELKRLEATRFERPNFVGTMTQSRVSFGRRGVDVRVRTADEPLGEPDLYLAGNGAALVPLEPVAPGAASLFDAPKPMSRLHYALIERVVLEPAAGSPERMQVWGWFAFGQRGSATYAQPRRGYLYLTLPPDRPLAYEAWTSTAGTGRVLRFFFVEYHRTDLTLWTVSDAPADPDDYTPISFVRPVRSDSSYRPISSLVSLR